MNILKKWIFSDDYDIAIKELKNYQEKLLHCKEEPIWEKKCLTVEEAAAYSGIGRSKLRQLANKSGCTFAIRMGYTIYIVREQLDKYIEKQFRI